jgi:hypothetical protein
MRTTNHVTLNLNINVSRAAVFLDIKKAFDTTRHSGLLYKLSKLKFSTSLIKLIAPFFHNVRRNVYAKGKVSGVPQGSTKHLLITIQRITGPCH